MWREDESSVNNREENRYKSIYIHICIYSFLYYNVILSVENLMFVETTRRWLYHSSLIISPSTKWMDHASPSNVTRYVIKPFWNLIFTIVPTVLACVFESKVRERELERRGDLSTPKTCNAFSNAWCNSIFYFISISFRLKNQIFSDNKIKSKNIIQHDKITQLNI